MGESVVALGHYQRKVFLLSELLTSEFQPVASFWGPPLRKMGIDFGDLSACQVDNPAFARPSAIRCTSSSLLKGCRPKCSLKEYFGLISLSSCQMRWASSTSSRWPRAEANKTRLKSVPGIRRMRSFSKATAVSYLPASRYAMLRKCIIIGAQLTVGFGLAVFFAPYFAGWGIAELVAFLIFGFAGGAALGAFVGYLRERFNASEIIVTIMLNYVAVQMVSYLIRGPMADPMPFWPRSYAIPPDCVLSVIVSGTRLHAGLIVALVMVIVFAVVQRQTVLGFQSSVFGANPGAATYAGFRAKALTIVVMAISGGLGGLAGAVEVGGVYQRIVENMGEGFGLAAIAVALIARLKPVAIPFAACLFGIFFAGAGALQRELALPFPLVWIVEATVIFMVSALHWALPSRKAEA